jgi:hypothetical protein
MKMLSASSNASNPSPTTLQRQCFGRLVEQRIQRSAFTKLANNRKLRFQTNTIYQYDQQVKIKCQQQQRMAYKTEQCFDVVAMFSCASLPA